MNQPDNILVFLPNWVGDVVMATPAIRALREAFGQAKITLFGRGVALAVLEGTAWADATITDRSRNKPRPAGLIRTVRDLRAVKADVAVLFPNSFRAAMLARLAGAKRRIGFDRDGRGWLLTDKLQPQLSADGPKKYKPIPMLDYYAELLKPLGLESTRRDMELPVTSQSEQAAQAMLDSAGYKADKPIVMLNAGASFGTSKLWLPERFAAVADALIEQRDAQIIINAAPSPNERKIAAEVAAAMTHKPLINFAECDNSIGLLKSLIKRTALMLTNDTGTRHLAAAFGCGVITIFGSTDPIWAQIDYPAERIVRVDVPCGPCQKKFCPLPPGEEHHRCIKEVTVEMVMEAARELMPADSEVAS